MNLTSHIATLVVILMTQVATSNAQNKSQPTKPTAQPLAPKLLASYKAPKIGAPTLRDSEATRGAEDPTNATSMRIRLVVPKVETAGRAGATAQESPSLYWIQSERSIGRLEISIVDTTTGMSILKYRHKGEIGAGLNKIDLARHKVVLEPDRPYLWSIIYYADRRNPSANLEFTATIMRLNSMTSTDVTSPEARSVRLAEAGAWLDVTDILAARALDAQGQSALSADLLAWLRESGISLDGL